MTRRRKIHWGIGIGVVAVIILARIFLSSGKGEELVLHTIERGTITEYISETGEVMAEKDLDLFFKATGRVSKVEFEEGDAIKEKEVIMRLDATDLYIRRQEAVATLSARQAEYQKALAGATPEQIRIAEIAVRNAEASLASAKQTLNDTALSNEASLDKAYSDLAGYAESVYLKASTTMQTLQTDVFSGSGGNVRSDIIATDATAAIEALNALAVAMPAKVRMDSDILLLRSATVQTNIDALAAALIADGKAVRDAASKANTLMQTSIRAQTLSQTTFDARVAAVKLVWTDMSNAVNTAETQRGTALNTKLSNISSGNVAAQKVRTAELALETSEQQLEQLKASLRDVDKNVYLASIASARASVSLVDQQIEDTILRSPVDGIVGTLDISTGELVTTVTRAASVISSDFLIESDVSELDIAKVSEGQIVEVSFDALPEQMFTGWVSKVAPRETREGDDIFYAVTIMLDDKDIPLRSGMTADLDINVGQKDDVLLVPRRQVIRRDGKTYVNLMREEQEEAEVVIGLLGNTEYEVLSGLSEGDQIVIDR